MLFSNCDILYEDRALIVVRKPAGLPVQSAGLGVKDLTGLLKTYLREKNPKGGEPYLGVVHRLDQPVRGLVVFAKTKKAAASLSAQLTDDRMEKLYLARVYLSGQDPKAAADARTFPENPETWQSLTDFLIKDPKANCSRVVSRGTPGAKEARLEYVFLPDSRFDEDISPAENHPSAVVKIRLLTGRHHQIRVQMSHAGMPLVGDHKYAAVPDSAKFPCLCAAYLRFVHPLSGKTMEFSYF